MNPKKSYPKRIHAKANVVTRTPDKANTFSDSNQLIAESSPSGPTIAAVPDLLAHDHPNSATGC